MESIKEGFLGQRMIVLPKNIVTSIRKNKLIEHLYFTDIGFFPHAVNHHMKRRNGSKEYILIYCSRGEGIIFLDNKTIILTPNTYFIIPPNIAHEYYAHEHNPWSIYWIHFKGDQAVQFYNKFSRLFLNKIPSVSLKENRIRLFDHFIDILESGYSESNIEYVNLALWQLLNLFIYEQYFRIERHQISENNTVEEAIQYMKNHLDTPLKIEDIAGKFNYSSSHFFTLFKKKTGYSPIHYFNYLKIQKACQYLSFTNMSIKEISFFLGFNDPLYFSRLFKKIMNTSPLGYRKEYSR